MNNLENRIAQLEARMPESQRPSILYIIQETDSELEREAIKKTAIGKYEQEHGVNVDEENVDFMEVMICYTKANQSSKS